MRQQSIIIYLQITTYFAVDPVQYNTSIFSVNVAVAPIKILQHVDTVAVSGLSVVTSVE